MSIEEAIKQFSSQSYAMREDCGKERSHAIAGFSQSSHSSQQNKNILLWFVAKCSTGLNVKPQDVIDGMLSPENEQEIINGQVSEIELRAFIEMWINDGRRRDSRKPY